MVKTPRPIPDQLDSLRRAYAQTCAGQGHLYALMDASLAPELPAALIEHNPQLDYVPLFLGDASGTLAEISPYLIRLGPDDDLLWWLLDEGQGKSWGIYLCSQAELTSLQHHLFCLLSVRGLEGDKLYFRYYDPRVLRPFWQVLNKEEQNQFMGPIQSIIVEDEKEPGFWAYQRPQDLEPPPYPPAPEDWTSLPEPWWQINHAQQQALSEAVLKGFLGRFADHLAETRDVLRPDYKADFHAKEYQDILAKQTNYFMEHSFETEFELAQALEYVHVFGLDLGDEGVKGVVEDQSMAIQSRLKTMRKMTKTGSNG